MKRSELSVSFCRICLVVALVAVCLLSGRTAAAGVCGDCNSDGQVDVGDVVAMIDFIFKSGDNLNPQINGDANCDGSVNVSDAVFILNHIFRSGAGPCAWCLPDEQQYFFEISYINFAWGATRRGMSIDAEGNIHKYTYAPEDIPFPVPSVMEPVTEAELTERYSHAPELIGSVPIEELTAMASLTVPAEAGPLSPYRMTCMDAGGMRFLAYRLDGETSLYVPILLDLAGDWAQTNFAHEAIQLYNWMVAVTGSGGFDGCRYTD